MTEDNGIKSTSRFNMEVSVEEKKTLLMNKNTKKATSGAANLFRDYLAAADLPCGVEFESFEPSLLDEQLAQFFVRPSRPTAASGRDASTTSHRRRSASCW